MIMVLTTRVDVQNTTCTTQVEQKGCCGHSGAATWACFWLMDIRLALQPWNPMYPGLWERKSTNIFRYLQTLGTPSWYGPPGAGSPHPAPMWEAVWGATWYRVTWSERSLPSFLVKRHNSIFYGDSEIIEIEILKLELEKCWNQIMHAQLLQLCLTLCDPIDCSLPDSSVHGILQARILEWVIISFSWGSSQPRDWTPHPLSPALAGEFFTTSATCETLIRSYWHG